MIKRPIFAIAGSFVLGEVLALLNVADISRIYGGLGAALLGCSLTLGKWRSRSGDSFLLFLRCSLGKICLFLCMAAAFGMGYGRAERETARFHREAEGARRLADVRSLVRGKVVRIREKENGTNLILEHAVLAHGVSIGHGNIIWNAVHLSHETKMENFNYLAPGTILAGKSEIGSNCFFGIGSSIRGKRYIADYTVVGAGAYINEKTEKCGVYLPARTKLLPQKKSADLPFQK